MDIELELKLLDKCSYSERTHDSDEWYVYCEGSGRLEYRQRLAPEPGKKKRTRKTVSKVCPRCKGTGLEATTEGHKIMEFLKWKERVETLLS